MQLSLLYIFLFFFFFNDTATTEIYTLSLHDALPIPRLSIGTLASTQPTRTPPAKPVTADRKSTRLNSSHEGISYADFCVKKKKRGQPGPQVNELVDTSGVHYAC